MRAVIATARVGDDSYREDPSVCELERYCAELFGREAALFTSTGTMSNQIAIRALTKPGDEVILDTSHHIHYFESAQTADLARVTLNVCETEDGVLTANDLSRTLAKKPRGWAYSAPTLVCVENTISCHAGRVFPLEALRALRSACDERSIAIYMDGARLLNACQESNATPAAYARCVTAVSLCFAKGLGAPFGSVLVGDATFIAAAKKYKKWYGGALHQAGFYAAAALYALENNRARLVEDHISARDLADRVAHSPGLKLHQAHTNMVMFDVSDLGVTASQFVEATKRRGVLLIAWTDTLIRAVTHLGITKEHVETAAAIISDVAVTGAAAGFPSAPVSRHWANIAEPENRGAVSQL
jgi:threonine aldolase